MKYRESYQFNIRRQKSLENQNRKRKEKALYPDSTHTRYSQLRPALTNDAEFKLLSLRHLSNLINYFRTTGSILKDERVKEKIKIPKSFKLSGNRDETIEVIECLCSSLYLSTDSVTIDFSECKSIEIGPSILLDIIVRDYLSFLDRFNSTNFKVLKKDINVIRPKDIDVTKVLHSLKIISIDEEEEKKLTGESYLPLGLKIGYKQRYPYRENIKGFICKEFRSFINNSLKAIHVELNETGNNNFDRLISEILGNAEDHSAVNSWFINGVTFQRSNSEDPMIEVCFAIINFGYSIYEGFDRTKTKNSDIWQRMERLYDEHASKMSISNRGLYTKEGLFTLYSLQEGISRIKYIDNSRGNGTMNFIRAFIDLGSVGNDNHKFRPKLSIVSGHTLISCDNQYGPYQADSRFFLSLNKDKDIRKLPNPNLIKHSSKYFPGTLLQVKIYLSSNHFKNILNNENNRSN